MWYTTTKERLLFMEKKKNKKRSKSNSLLIGLIVTATLLAVFQATQKVQSATSICESLTGDAHKKCDEWENKAQDIRDLIEINNKKQATVQKQMALIDAQQKQTQAELMKTRGTVENLAQKMSDLEREISQKEEQIKAKRVVLAKLMQSYYEDYQQGVLDIVLLNKDVSDALSQSDYIEQSSLRASDLLQTIRETQAQLKKEQDQIIDAKRESENLKEELEDKNLSLQKSESQKQALLGQTQAEKLKYEELLSNIEEEINRLEESLSSSLNTANLPPDKDGYFTWPVNPHIQTQGYGKTSFAKTSGMYKNNFHNGLDFGISYKSVFAAKSGKIIASGDNGKYAYGKWIAIDHGDGLTTLYGHLSSKSVSKGDKVTEGQKIGVSGNTGNSTGPHLHFSVFASSTFKTVESSYVNGLMIPTGASVNPQKYL